MKINYYVSLDKPRDLPCGGFTTFEIFTNRNAAMRCLKKNPRSGQIDIRFPHTHKKPFCWKYWDKGKIIDQGWESRV